MQRGEHAQAQQVELDQAGVRAVVLVPLQHGAAGHGRPFHRAHLADRPVADHHSAGVDAQVPGQPLQLPRQLRHGRGDGAGQGLAGRRGAGADLPRPLAGRGGRVAERPAGVAQRQPGPVGDDVGYLRGAVPAVAVVDVLDDLFAPPVLDVQVDVWRPVPALGQEPLEQQPVPYRVDVGDADRVADRRVRRRSASLAEDPGIARRTGRCRGRSGSTRGSRAARSRQARGRSARTRLALSRRPGFRTGWRRPPGRAARTPRCARPARGSPAGSARRPGSRRRTPVPARRCDRGPPGSGAAAPPSPRRSGGRRCPRRGASRPCPAATGGPGWRRARPPAGTGPAWRSARSRRPPRPGPATRPGQTARRSARRRTGRSGRPAPRRRSAARTSRSASAAPFAPPPRRRPRALRAHAPSGIR